mgnify:CR=1 FL=1
MQLVERKQTTNPTQRATRHGCFATAADFHPQASLAHFACGEMTEIGRASCRERV